MSDLLCLSFVIIFVASTRAHVTLTFPEARFPPLDFLDTFRTAAPCGVPKSSKSVITNLRVGNSYNVTWRMQYPHQGGFRLQLLSASGQVVQQLAPLESTESENVSGLDDQTWVLSGRVESHIVQFIRECHKCTLRLERQALEWGKSYKFRSCAEVNVIAQLSDKCSSRGELSDDGTCSCHEKYSGEHCQYANDCIHDSDCLNGGKCVANGIAPDRKSCFCAYGFFGETCTQKSSRSESAGNADGESCFAYDSPIDSNLLKYGIFNVNCFKSFALNTPDDDFIYSRVIKGEIEIVLNFATDSWLGLGWRPLQIPNTCRLFPDLTASATVSTIDAEGGRNDSENIAIGGFTHSALDASLHAMDCADVVMASIYVDAANDKSFLHIRDMYTRDRSTPLSDAFYDGEQSLTAAFGYQIRISENMTRSIVMFRRMIREIEPTDHPLGPGEVFVIFAKGQTDSAYNHLAKSAIERGKSLNAKNFYRVDQWKYHGGKNRGVRNLEFVFESEISDSDSPLKHLKTKIKTSPSALTKTQTTKALEDNYVTSTIATIIESAEEKTIIINTNEFDNDFNVLKISTKAMKLDDEAMATTEPTVFDRGQQPQETTGVDLLLTARSDNTPHITIAMENKNSSVMPTRLSFLLLILQFIIIVLFSCM